MFNYIRKHTRREKILSKQLLAEKNNFNKKKIKKKTIL